MVSDLPNVSVLKRHPSAWIALVDLGTVVDLGVGLDLSLFTSRAFQDLLPFPALDSNTTHARLERVEGRTRWRGGTWSVPPWLHCTARSTTNLAICRNGSAD